MCGRVERGLVFAPADFLAAGRDKPADQCGSDGCSDRDHDAEVATHNSAWCAIDEGHRLPEASLR